MQFNRETFTVLKQDSAYFDGQCLVTDPCYLLGEIWDELCDVFFRDAESKDHNLADRCVVVYKNATFILNTTKWGDGAYTVNGSGQFGVDAGMMCVVLIADLERLGIELPANGLATEIGIHGLVRGDGEGKFFYDAETLVDTDDAPGDDDSDSWYEE